MDLNAFFDTLVLAFAFLCLFGLLIVYLILAFKQQRNKDDHMFRFFDSASRYFNLVTKNYPNGCHYDPHACANCLKVEECREIDADLIEEE